MRPFWLAWDQLELSVRSANPPAASQTSRRSLDLVERTEARCWKRRTSAGSPLKEIKKGIWLRWGCPSGRRLQLAGEAGCRRGPGRAEGEQAVLLGLLLAAGPSGRGT